MASTSTRYSAALSLWPIGVVLCVRIFFPEFHHLQALAAVTGGLSLIIRALWSANYDPYGLFHLSLNKLPGEDPTSPPRTEWLNMGFWKETDVFPEACRALAIKMLQKAEYSIGGHVLDVGHGTGESLVLFLTDPEVIRPASLTGITSLLSHCQRSGSRIQMLSPKPDIPLNLYHGDAVYRAGAKGHPLDPSSKHFFQLITALDCAYHFNSRKTFLQQSYDHLVSNGCVALADICFTPAALQNPITRLLVSVLGIMPKANMLTPDTYVDDLKNIGFMDVQLEDITKDVFPGFISFLKSRGVGWIIFAVLLEAFVDTGAQFVVVSARKP